MASLSELMQAAEYKQQAKLARKPVNSAVNAITGGFNKGFDLGMTKEMSRDPQKELETAYNIMFLQEKIKQQQQENAYQKMVQEEVRKQKFEGLGTKKQGEGIVTDAGKVSGMVDDAFELAGNMMDPYIKIKDKNKDTGVKVIDGSLVRYNTETGKTDVLYQGDGNKPLSVSQKLEIAKRRRELITDLDTASGAEAQVITKGLRDLEAMEGKTTTATDNIGIPNSKTPAGVKEGVIIVNPKTGERMKLKNGAWIKL